MSQTAMKDAPPATTASHTDTIEIDAIMAMIPHRYPFLLIDRLVNVETGVKATGIKNVTINEPFFPGHFPGKPIMPGVLIIESMAQTSAAFVVHTLGEEAMGKLVYFMSIEDAHFRKPVRPGDRLEVTVEKIHQRRNVWKFAGIAHVDGVKVADATFSAMIVDR